MIKISFTEEFRDIKDKDLCALEILNLEPSEFNFYWMKLFNKPKIVTEFIKKHPEWLEYI